MKHSIPFGLLALCALATACTVTGTARIAQPDNSVWVCHGGGNHARWQRVSADAAQAHQRHGDFATQEPQTRGAPCGGRDDDRGRDRRN